MLKALHEKLTFTKVDYTNTKLSDVEFDSCIFVNCNFTKTDLSNIDFLDCKFQDCIFSMVKLNNTGLKSASFAGCKLMGIDFTKCKDFLLSFRFDRCSLDYSNFYKKKIRSTVFNECSIREVEFSEADLTSSSFLLCDLTRTVFQHTVLEKADFRSARNFSIDLETNRVKGAKFSSAGVIGLLDKYQVIVED
ncbi:MAG: pentapeptide repeat-containing protein [Bacteroidales bacterium]